VWQPEQYQSPGRNFLADAICVFAFEKIKRKVMAIIG
jgi:hypothetical protein